MAHIQIDSTVPRISYVATAAQDTFTVPFAFFANADLVVYVDDELQALGTDYDVAGAGESDGGSITFVTPLAGGESVVIVRDIEIARITDFPAAGPFNINSLNTQLDKLIAIAQQLQNDIQRTLRLADSDATENLDIPAAADRANKFLGFDADGAPFVAEAVADQPATAFMLTLLDDATAAIARATLGLGSTDAVTHAGVTSRGTSSGAELAAEQYSADTVGAKVALSKSRHATPGSHTIVASGDVLGLIAFEGSNGTSFDAGASVQAVVDGTPGASADMPGALVLSTSADGSATPTERMAIRANGKVQIPNRSAPLIQFDGSGYADLGEISAPSNPSADTARAYAVDESGTTNLAWRDSGGVVSGLRAATQAEMEAGTSVLRTVSPGRQHFHPGHPKAGGNLNGSGTPAFRSGDYGMGAVTDNGVGDYTVAFDTSFNNTNYWCAGFGRSLADDTIHMGALSALASGSKTAGAMRVKGFDVGGGSAGADGDLTEMGMTFWGDYA